MYLGLPSQCRKCCEFGHFVRACIVSKVPIWDGNAPAGKLPTWSERVAKGSDSMPPSKPFLPPKTLGGIMKLGAKTTKRQQIQTFL